VAGEIKKLEEMCEKFGGKLLKVTRRQYDKLKEDAIPVDGYKTFFDATFSVNDLGIHWPSRTIVYAGEVHWWEVVHEMGHTFAQESNPNDCEDEENFIGWEYLLVQMVGDLQPWLDANEHYSTGDFELGELEHNEKIAYLEKSILRGQELGIIDKDRKLWAYVRQVKAEEMKEEFIADVGSVEFRLEAVFKKSITNGNDFEERCQMEGFVRGYREAVALALKLLDKAVVTPLPPLGKR